MRVDMRVDMRIDMRVGMRIDMRVDMRVGICRFRYGHGYRKGNSYGGMATVMVRIMSMPAGTPLRPRLRRPRLPCRPRLLDCAHVTATCAT